MKKIENPMTGEISYDIERKQAFKEVTRSLKVLARANSYMKYTLINGLMENSLVAITGSGQNDVPTLKLADVGISFCDKMGAEGSKDASDIVLMEDSISSVFEALMCGRILYANVRKFLQFQLTMNMVSMILMITGSLSFGIPPITPGQMLWLNVILDTLGLLALATEPPTIKALKENKPLKRDERVQTDAIIRNIILGTFF